MAENWPISSTKKGQSNASSHRPTYILLTIDPPGPTPSRELTEALASKPCVEDALSYLYWVKERFANQRSVYGEFLDILRQCKREVIDTAETIKRAARLLRHHPDLIEGLNDFMYPGNRIVHVDANTTLPDNYIELL